MTARPLGDQVIVRLTPEPTRGGAIHVVRLDEGPAAYAEVVSVGPDVLDGEIEPGRRVLISRLQGVTIGDDVLTIPESAVLAFVEEESDESEPV